jgi:uncharacterized protein (TIGR02246 family)
MKYLPLKSILSFATFVFMIPILVGCSKQKMTHENATAQKEKEQKLEEFFISVEEAVHSGDKYAYANLFTPDGTLFLPDRPPIIGREAIADWYEKFYNKITHITDSYDQKKVDIVGNIAIVRSRGTGSYIIKETEEQIPLQNKYIDVLKYTNGKWLWMYHMASSFSFDPGLWDRDWENE